MTDWSRGVVPPRRKAGYWAPLFFVAVPTAFYFFLPDVSLFLPVVIFAGLVAMVLEWEILVSLMFATGFLVGPMKISGGGWVAYAIPDVVTGMVLLRWLGSVVKEQKLAGGRTPVTGPFLLLVWYLIMEFMNPDAPLIRSVFGLRSWLMYTALLFAGYSGYRNLDQVERLYRVLFTLGVMTALNGIWQWQHGPEALSLWGESYADYASQMRWSPQEGPSVFRSISTFVTPTAFASNMAFIILLALGSVLSRKSSRRWKVCCVAAMAIMGGGVAVSGSRMGPAILAIGLVMIVALFRKFRTLFIALLVGPLSLWLIREVAGGILAERFTSLLNPDIFFWKWANALAMGMVEMSGHPLGNGLGYSVGVPQFITRDELIEGLRTGSVADSGYGVAALELGLPGLVLFAWFVIRLSAAGIRAWQALPEDGSRDVLLGAAVSAASLPVLSLLMAPQASLPASSYFWLLIGMALRAGELAAPGAAAPEEVPRSLRAAGR